MIEPVDSLIPRFASAGAETISFHPEASPDVGRSLATIRAAGCKAGLVFNPDVPLTRLREWIEHVDLVLLMSVYPGFGGQKFIESTLPRIETVRAMIDSSYVNPRLEVDGGLTIENVGAVAAAGADTFVAGSTIFGSEDYAATIAAMRREIAVARNR
jgi:ribulose-phosphate 3-epimerase